MVPRVPDLRSHSLPSKPSYARSKMFQPPVSQNDKCIITSFCNPAIAISACIRSVEEMTQAVKFTKCQASHHPAVRQEVHEFPRHTMRHTPCHQHSEMQNKNAQATTSNCRFHKADGSWSKMVAAGVLVSFPGDFLQQKSYTRQRG